MTLRVKVAVPVPLPRLFDYAWTAIDIDPPLPGARVVVEFGRRKVVAVAVEMLLRGLKQFIHQLPGS